MIYPQESWDQPFYCTFSAIYKKKSVRRSSQVPCQPTSGMVSSSSQRCRGHVTHPTLRHEGSRFASPLCLPKVCDDELIVLFAHPSGLRDDGPRTDLSTWLWWGEEHLHLLDGLFLLFGFINLWAKPSTPAAEKSQSQLEIKDTQALLYAQKQNIAYDFFPAVGYFMWIENFQK